MGRPARAGPIEGGGDRVLSIGALGAHVCLLAVIPLFFLCEAMLGNRPAHFVRTVVDSQTVLKSELPALEAEIARTNRLKDSGRAEAICVLLAALSPLIAQYLHLPGATANYDPGHAGDGMTRLTGIWYWVVCMTVFRFLMFRWLWRLALWTQFLWRLSRLRLQLAPTHPDGAGGLG
jgi:hypothetical protein